MITKGLFFALVAVGVFPLSPAWAIDIFRRPATTNKESDDKAKLATVRYLVETVKDIAYRTDAYSDKARHNLDLYYPKGVSGYPVVVFVHGGSWQNGDKSKYAKLGESLASVGLGAVLVNYRLTPQVQHPAHAEDVANAFGWVCRNIARYGGRADQIFLSGHSAGGHLVALLATDDKYVKMENRSFNDIRGVISISGVHDLPVALPWVRTVFGSRDDLRKASPVNHVGKTHPPFLFMYADRDYPTLGRMSEDMHEELQKNKCESQIVKIPNRTHISIISSMVNEDDEARQQLLNFVEKHSDWKMPKADRARGLMKREDKRR